VSGVTGPCAAEWGMNADRKDAIDAGVFSIVVAAVEAEPA
jgi:hypothetical protein